MNRFQVGLLTAALLVAGCAAKPIATPSTQSASLHVSIGGGRQLQAIVTDAASASITVEMVGYSKTLPFTLRSENQAIADFSNLHGGDATVSATVFDANNLPIANGKVFSPIQLGRRNYVTVRVWLKGEGHTPFRPLMPLEPTTIPTSNPTMDPSETPTTIEGAPTAGTVFDSKDPAFLSFLSAFGPAFCKGMKRTMVTTMRYDGQVESQSTTIEEILDVADGIYTEQYSNYSSEGYFGCTTATGSMNLADDAQNDANLGTITIEGSVLITVPAGTFETVKLRFESANSPSATEWLAKGVGPVKIAYYAPYNGKNYACTSVLTSLSVPSPTAKRIGRVFSQSSVLQ